MRNLKIALVVLATFVGSSGYLASIPREAWLALASHRGNPMWLLPALAVAFLGLVAVGRFESRMPCPQKQDN
jgi:hypothetical protein